MSNKPAYTVAEVAAMTGLSRQTVTRLFDQETGVIVIASERTMNKRRYRSIRIPHSVYERVIRGITN